MGLFYNLLKNIFKENVNIKQPFVFNYIFFIFFIIFLSNNWGLIPFSYTVTSSIIVAFFLSFSSFIIILINGNPTLNTRTHFISVSCTHLRAHERRGNLVCRLLLENRCMVGSIAGAQQVFPSARMCMALMEKGLWVGPWITAQPRSPLGHSSYEHHGRADATGSCISAFQTS